MSGFDKRGIDEILLSSGVLNIEQLKQAWDIQRENKKKVEDVLLELGFVTEKDILAAKAEKMGVEFVNLSEYEISDPAIPKLITENIANRYFLVPIEKNDSLLTVAMKDPTDIFAIDDLRLATSLEIKPVFAEPEEINKLLKKFYYKEPPVKKEPVPVPPQEINRDFNSVNEVASIPVPKKEEVKLPVDSGPEPISGMYRDKIGKLLVKSGLVTEEQIQWALEMKAKTGERVGEILVKEGYIERKELYECLEKQLGVPHVDLEDANIPGETVKLVSENISRRYTLVPVDLEGNVLKVAMSDPMNIFSVDDLRLATGLEIVPLLADALQINTILDKHYAKINEVKKVTEEKKKLQDFEEEIKKVNEKIAVEIKEATVEEDTIDLNDVENAPIVKMVNIIFQQAIASGASDIHIEAYEDCVMVRYRIDGQLVETMKHDKKILSALIARIKIISGLNIAEKRVPQDGRITLKIENNNYDLRVSILPTIFGEKAVIRIADKDGFNVSKKELGFFDDDLQKFEEILAHPYGIVLVTGPTGSGKSTTLYTALRELCQPNVNILTVEDPVECTVRGINQVQVNTKAGLTFAAALRSFLRQDPDIIMVGEIRDAETAEIATRAAITGHLVLSTLHTNDAASSLTRIIDMGIEPFMISSSVVGVIAQRLVRRLCPKCKEEYAPGANERDILKIGSGEETKIYLPKGCEACNNTGYKGRIAIYEIMTLTRELRELIAKNVPSDIIKEHAVKNGMKTLRDNCARLVKSGVTSVDEMLRVTYTKE